MKQFSIQLLVLLGLSYSLMGQQVKFNEVQTSNSKTQIDPDFYKFKDWVELYNTGSSSVDLSGYFITDDKNEPRKWQIPSGQSIAPKGYVLIYCDGENVTGKAMHTNFRLSAEGESLYLYSSTMLLVDTVTVGRVETDYTYGRVTNGTGVWAALSEPTPNASNVSTTVKGVASKPAFSKVGGFYNANQTITLSSSIPGAVIRYTTDGSEPTESSPEYTKAITASKQSGTSLRLGYDAQNKTQVQQYSWEDPYGKLNSSYYTNMFTSDVNKAFVLKAKVFHDDYVPSPTVCQTYFINMNRPSLPVVSVVTDKANFFNADSGIYIQGTNGIYSGGSGDVKANWNQDWERKGYVEYYDASGTRQFGVNAGLSAMGAVSRHTDLKSLNVIMRNEYEPGAIEYPIFGDDGNNVYESFLLRNSGNDWEQGVFARDAMFQSIVRGQFDMETQDYQPVVMYLNGEYWSMINMRERYDKRYFSAKYDYVDANDIDILKVDGDHDCFTASSGDSLRWEEMFAYLKANSMADAANYDYVKNHYLDVDNMINYYISELYCQNTDWPNNNFRLWRPKTENGKFRFPLYDTDFGYGLWGGSADKNPFENFDKNPNGWITVVLFYYMMENEDFYNEFIQRFYYMINTTFDVTRSKTIINNIENTISSERSTSDDYWYRKKFQDSQYRVSSILSFAENRPGHMKNYLSSKFGGKGTSTLTVNYNNSQGLVTLCGLDVTAGYAGAQYKNTPIRLNAIPKDGYKFLGWQVGGTTVSTDEEYKLTITSSTIVQAVFQARANETGLVFNEVMAANTSTIQNENLKYEDWFEIYNSSSAPINLAGLYLSDDPATPLKYKIPYGTPDSTTVPAKGYIVFWADNESQDGPLHCPFKLDKSGDTLLLSQVSSSGTVTTLATLTFVSQNSDVSYGCYPDANSNKIVFTTPTPRATNKVSSTNMLSAGDLVITEMMAKNKSIIVEETGTYADWFEVYNSTNSDIDMGGLFVTNNLDNLNMYYIPKGQPALTTVPAKGYLLFWADKQTAINPNHVNFKLSAEQGHLAIVQLQGATNLIIDQLSYTNQGEDVSYGRYPSTTSDFVYLVNPTPGEANVSNGTIALKDGVTINEVLAQNTSIVADENGLYSDYIEFYNTTGAAIDLGGLFISDSANYSLRYRIPQGYSAKTTVGSKDWLVFWADDSSRLGVDHLGFSLDVLGEDVVLSQIASDGTIHTIDAVTYDAQSANISYGRYTDGVDYWESMTPTYNAANQSINSSTALKTLTTSVGNITPTVSSSVTEYVCQLPAGTETVPTISATTVNSGATVSITQASSLTSNATVTVISKNGYYSTDYVVSFLITESSDATLASLTLGGGTLSPSFNPESTNYVASLTTTSVPFVTAIPTNKNSMVEIDYAATVSEATTITVTAEDGTTNVYTITYQTTTSQNVVTEWTEDFADGAGGFTVHATDVTDYIITPNAGSVNVVLNETGEEPFTDYAYFEYHLPTGYVLNGTSALNVSMDITSYLDYEVVNGYTIGKDGQYVSFYIAMVDAYGNVSDYVEYPTTVNANTESILIDMSTATYVTKSVIVAVRFAMYGPNQVRKERTKAVRIDNLVIGPETSGGGSTVPTLSSDATLKTITTTLGTLSPTVSNATKSYTLTLPAGTTTIPTISATALDNTATVEVAQSESLDGTAYVRIISEDMTVINDFTIDVVLTPTVVDGYTDYVIKPAMTGWSESSSLYAMTYNSGEIDVNYTRSSALSDAITYDITKSANYILDLTNYPYASVALSSTVATTLTAELFDANGNVTTSVTANCVAGSGVATYLFNFTDKFSSADKANIYGMKLYFDKGSSTTKSGTIAIDELRFGSKVVLETNEAPVWATISNQSIYQGATFTNISLYNFVSDDYTSDANLTLAVSSGGENLNLTITGGILSISAKDASWIGTETIAIKATDADGLYSTTSITFSVAELQIALNSVAFTQTSVNVAQNATVDLLSYLTYSPTNATIESITWSLVSDNAVISTDGVVTNNLDYGTESVTATVVVVDKNGNSYEKTITVVLTGCPTKVTQVSLTQSSANLYYQETAQLTYTLTPSGACEKSVSYSSSNTSVATVSSTGLITAQSVSGSATITISVNDGFSVKTATCVVTVSKDCTGDIVLSLDKSNETLVQETTLTITPTITPNDECTESNVITWISSDESIATVVDGVVTGISPGNVTITASTTGNGTTTVTCNITVQSNCISEGIIVSLNTSAETLHLSSVPLQLTATYTPVNLCDETIVWTSSSESVATVSSTGIVTPISYGITEIRATSAMDGTSYASATITVVEKEVTSVTLNSTTLALLIGEEQVLTAIVVPADADNTTIDWTSSNTSVATVDANGKVTAVAEGTANIVATAASGVSKSCTVTVSPVDVTNITLNISNVTLTQGDNQTVTVTFEPDSATNQNLTWTSLNPSVATVVDGVITAVAEGTATITVTTANGISKTIEVTVDALTIAVESVTISGESANMYIAGTMQLNATVLPTEATNQTITWVSSNPSIATVSSTGLVTAKATGNVTITAFSANGESDAVAISVIYRSISSVTLSETTIALAQGESINLASYLTVNPVATELQSTTWALSSTEHASITAAGVLTNNLDFGQETITAEVTVVDMYGVSKTATIEIVLTGCATEISSVSVPTSVVISMSENYTLSPVYTPSNACVESVSYVSDDESIAIVTDGVISPVSIGETTITATFSDGFNTSVKTISVTVQSTKIPVTSLTFSSTTYSIFVGDTLQMNVSILPIDATNQNVTWTTTNASVATISETGELIGLSAGNTTIKAISSDGPTATCIVYVSAVPVTSVVLNSTTNSMYVYDTYQLQATVNPSNATDKTITWTSSNTSIATVSADGLVTAVKAGLCEITATSSNNKTAKCQITVLDIEPESITVSVSSCTLDIGKTQAVTVTFNPTNVTNTSLNWSSSNVTIATVSANGTITAVSPGIATITVTTVNGVSKQITVTVNEQLATSITLNTTAATLQEGEQQTLVATISPSNTTNKAITWSTSNSSVATVDATGKITAVAVGNAVITATTANGLKADCSVSVTIYTVPVSSVTVSPSTLDMYVGGTSSLSALISPSNASNKSLTWSSSKSSVATIDQDGNITAVGVGTTTIKATASNNVYGTCEVTVNAIPVESVSLAAVSLAVEESQTLSAIISPSNATDKTITWSVYNTDIATISSTGKITGKAEGSTIVYARASNGVVGSAVVTVSATAIEVQSITAKASNYIMSIGSQIDLSSLVTFTPANATNKALTAVIASSVPDFEENADVVSISGSTITALVAGTVQLTITATSSNVSTIIEIGVNPIGVSTISLNKSNLELVINASEELIATILPKNASNKSVEWSSSNPNVAYVSSEGMVLATGVGTAVITVTSKYNSSISTTCSVEVLEYPVTNLTPDPTSFTMKEGDIKYVELAIQPLEAVNSVITWESSNESVVTVNNGQIIAIGLGTAVVTATASSGVSCEIACTVKTPNIAPQVINTISNQTLAVGSSVVINLADYFFDENEILWSPNDMGSNISCEITSSGVATFTVKDPNGVGGEQYIAIKATDSEGLFATTQILFTITGISGNAVEDIALQTMKVYPNPTVGPVKVSFETAFAEKCLIEIYSTTGMKIKEYRAVVDGEYSKTIDLSGNISGCYIMVITTENSKKQFPIILK